MYVQAAQQLNAHGAGQITVAAVSGSRYRYLVAAHVALARLLQRR